MLVLTRKRGERVVVSFGERRAVVTLVEVRGDKVRIGFDGPHDVKFWRQEIQDDIDAGRPPKK